MTKVFMINVKKDWDISGAELYGELIPVFRDTIPHVFDISKMCHELREAMVDISEDDYLLLGGNVIPNSVAVAIVLSKYPTVNLLIYSMKDKEYVPRTVARHHVQL